MIISFNVYLFKILSIHIFWTNLLPKWEVLQTDWNYYLLISILMFVFSTFLSFIFFGQIWSQWKEKDGLSEERLALLMKEIFLEEFKKQERNIRNIISGNTEFSMNKIKNLKQEISELKSNLDSKEDILEKKVLNWKKTWKTLTGGYQVDPNYVLDKVAELEDRSRRNNLRIDEINKEKGETWEMCEIRLKIFFRRN